MLPPLNLAMTHSLLAATRLENFREDKIWQGFAEAPLLDQLQRLQEAAGLCLSQARRYGGPESAAWLQEQRGALRHEIVRQGRYAELITTRSDGRVILQLPPDITPPPLLHVPEETQRPELIFDPGAQGIGIGNWAYLCLEDLCLIQNTICTQCRDGLSERFQRGDPVNRPQLAYDSHRQQYFLRHGYHRAMAALSLGAPYLLVTIALRVSRPSQTYTFGELRWIEHAEHQKIIAAVQGDLSQDPFEDRSF